MSKWNFRWFADSRTDVIRPAKAALERADQEFREYGEHQLETRGPGSTHWTPECDRLNARAWNAQQRLRKVRGW